jgi:hypothetical protein
MSTSVGRQALGWRRQDASVYDDLKRGLQRESYLRYRTTVIAKGGILSRIPRRAVDQTKIFARSPIH